MSIFTFINMYTLVVLNSCRLCNWKTKKKVKKQKQIMSKLLNLFKFIVFKRNVYSKMYTTIHYLIFTYGNFLPKINFFLIQPIELLF